MAVMEPIAVHSDLRPAMLISALRADGPHIQPEHLIYLVVCEPTMHERVVTMVLLAVQCYLYVHCVRQGLCGYSICHPHPWRTAEQPVWARNACICLHIEHTKSASHIAKVPKAASSHRDQGAPDKRPCRWLEGGHLCVVRAAERKANGREVLPIIKSACLAEVMTIDADLNCHSSGGLATPPMPNGRRARHCRPPSAADAGTITVGQCCRDVLPLCTRAMIR